MKMSGIRTGANVSGLCASSLAILMGCALGASSARADDAATVPHSYLVFFDFNKSVLTPEALKVVDQAAADVAVGKPAAIEVTGYTDTVGSDAYNLRLSKRRAVSVEAELTRQGVPAGIIAIYAKGKHDLLVPTKDGVKEPQNRRAAIVYATAAAAPAVEEKKADEAAAATAPPVFGVWAQLEAGITANPRTNAGRLNFGHLFTDKANQPVLNQILLTAERPADPNATDYDLSYRVQGMFGTDARYTHFLGELDKSISDRTQVDIVEAWVNLHTPWLTDGGMDFKAGQFVTYLGAETIDPSGNFLYSKSYIFNFGIPLKHTGFMTITHVNPTLDIYLGADTGVNTTFDDGDPNTAFAFQGGFGLNGLMDGKLTVLGITHIGPENPIGSVPHANSALRYLNDLLFTYKPDDKLTLLTEFNFIRDDGFHSIGYGAAEYLKYQIEDDVAITGRAEIWRDNNNFFVAGFRGNTDFVRFELGQPLLYSKDPYVSSGEQGTTYGAITVGLNYTPTLPFSEVQAFTIRPEVRFDDALNGAHTFTGGKESQVTLGLDFIVKI